MASGTLVLRYGGIDYEGRKLFIDLQSGRGFVVVEGMLYWANSYGEPSHPVGDNYSVIYEEGNEK